MKKFLSFLFVFNLFFISPVILINGSGYLIYAQEDGGDGEGGDGGGDGENGNGINSLFLDTNEDSGPGEGGGGASGVADPSDNPTQTGFLAGLAEAVANLAFTVTNALASVAYSIGLETVGNAITSFGYSFGSNVASEEGFTAVAAGAAASAATGGVGGFVLGQAVTGAMQGTIAGDLAGIASYVTGGSNGNQGGGTDTPKNSSANPLSGGVITDGQKALNLNNFAFTDYCTNKTESLVLNASDPYKKFTTQTYKSNWGNNDQFIFRLDIKNTDTTKGVQPVSLSFSDSLASRAFVRATISRNKCDFGPTAQWFGREAGWQPSQSDISRYTYSDGTKPTQYLGDNSGNQLFTINDERNGYLNLTTGTWYINFEYLDNCADRNTANPNRNTTCHKVVQWSGGTVTKTADDLSKTLDISNSTVNINTLSQITTAKVSNGYNDLGVAIPKSLSIDDIINPSLLTKIKAWAGLPVSDNSGSVKSGVVSTGGVTSINMCPPGQSYPDSKFGQYHDLPSRQMYKNTDPTRTYTIEFPIKDVTTAGKITAQLPQIRYELPVGVSNDWDATVSRNPCDFSSSAQVLINTGNSGWRYFTVDDTRTSPAGTLNLAPGKWYINFKQARKCLTPGIPESSPNQNDCGIFFELTPNELQEYIGESTGVTNNSPAMVAVSGYAGGMGTAAAQAILSTAFLKDENLTWAKLCSESQMKSTILKNETKDYSRQLKAGIEVYPVTISSATNYEGSFYAVGLSASTNNPIYTFISDTPCAGTSANVYSFGGGISGSQASFTNTNYTGTQPGNVKVKPGKWYVTLLWGSGAVPALTSPNYQSYLTNPTPVYVRFSNRLIMDGAVAPITGTGTGTGTTQPTFTPRTISNSSCTINLAGSQYGLVSTTLVYKKFLPNAGGSYWMGSMVTYTPEALAATLDPCPSANPEGQSSGKIGNRGTFRNINAECKVYDDKTRETTIYKLDYPDGPEGCYSLCSSSKANPAAFIDVRGDCVLNGTASF